MEQKEEVKETKQELKNDPNVSVPKIAVETQKEAISAETDPPVVGDVKPVSLQKSSKIFKFIRKDALFFVICFVSFYLIITIFANGWTAYKAEENDNWFHEILGALMLIGFCAWSYFRIYRQSERFLKLKQKQEAQQKAKEISDKKQEEGKKRTAFLKIITDYQAAATYETKSLTLTKLLTVAIESPSLRQKAVDLIAKENDWMKENALFLQIQNLILWRIKRELFDKSDRFQVNTETQDMSIKAINTLEIIIKKHIVDFKEGNVTEVLDLSGKAIPTLTVTAQYIPAGSLLFENSFLWKGSFSETIIEATSFANADLYGVSFWRSRLQGVDFEGAKLEGAKFRTDIQQIKHLTADQFFATKDWELCFLSREQLNEYFDLQDLADPHWSKWIGATPKREKLYFNFQQM